MIKMINISKFKSVCENLWFISKQVWYVPFIWSLAWFSYWISHGLITLKQSPLQGNPLHYIGAAISITALLIAGHTTAKLRIMTLFKKPARAINVNASKISRFPTKAKAYLFRKISFKKQRERKNLPQKPAEKFILKEQEHSPPKTLKPQIDHQSLIKSSQSPKPQETPMSSQQQQTPPSPIAAPQSLVSINPVPNQTEKSQTQKTQETNLDCLICPKLISCNHRYNRPAETETPCPYAS
jgi:hypothetical protein